VADRGDTYVMPPELTEEEQLAVAVLISQEEEMRAFPGFDDALTLSVVPSPPPGPPPLQPPWTPPVRPRCDAWPGGTPAWPATSPPVIGWAPATPTLPLPMTEWPWAQPPFIDFSGDNDDDA
jgi:hypothetical protein